jgi:hypothetical protein
VWCGQCYSRDGSDRFHINENLDEDGNPQYDCKSDESRFKQGIDGAQLMTPFQCDLCVFRTLYKRNPRQVTSDADNLTTIRRMNLDALWSREPSTIANNMRTLATLIATCEGSGFEPQIPNLGPFPIEDKLGYSVAFSMLKHSLRPGRHSKVYTQFATIRKQRSAFSNVYMASQESAKLGMIIAQGSQTNSFVTSCPTNSLWFTRWSLGCETRMGFILKQNKAISIELFLELVADFKREIQVTNVSSWERHRLCLGLCYSVIMYCASLRGSEGLKVDLQILVKNFDKGNYREPRKSSRKPIPHVIIPVKGRFKGEKGERCHLLPLASVTASGICVREVIKLLIVTRREMRVHSPWAFVNSDGSKMKFSEMNEIILERVEAVQNADSRRNELDLRDLDIREEFSINRSFRRGSSTHAQNAKVPPEVVEAQNRWRKIERAKGKKPSLAMIETYADIEQLIPTLVRYSAML